MHPARRNYPQMLYWIAAFKLLKAIFLLTVAIGALKLLHKDVAAEAGDWADLLSMDPGSRYVRLAMEKLSTVDDSKLRKLSVGTFVYAALFLTEGTGLALRKRWAEYFTAIVTCSFIPLEVYEVALKATPPRGAILVLNIVVAIYLAIDLRRSW